MLCSLLFAPGGLTEPYAKFLLATSILFCAGLAEDLGWHQPPKVRLAAAVMASLATIVLLDAWIPRLGIPALDPLAGHWATGAALTIFVVTGISNGFNLIDGVNGLAGIAALCATVALTMIASNAGYEEMVLLASMIGFSILGFLLLNYPFGKIFLGDAGAYTLGFVLSWFGISILLNSTSVTPWAILLCFFWPVADTVLAIYRRKRQKRAAMQPDRLHAHHMVMRALERRVFREKGRQIVNPLTTLILVPFVAAPPLTGVLLWDQTLPAFIAFVAFSLVFFGSYRIAATALKTRQPSLGLLTVRTDSQ
ncbi:MraY family glycosyltransferase [Aestuariicoccus sp. MJ-SS9]|uniref:glycosyltransferase family 4 protein n=1 Tax=Aestuariicoccus sp. MJ-SS9 TaxID=3079855 RepID=UPI002914966F|nr:MraY family glycosyltransferase [Aestuariicoccus sp. MJ-SS9]MDU8914052.1 MraY family glycosyltransferase [Aestuariicoccus sp. MJ-SS9]